MLKVHTLDEGSEEDKYAKRLAQIAIEGCPSIETDEHIKLDIIPNILISGNTTKDIDILVIYRSKNQSFLATVELKLHSPSKIKLRNNNCYVVYKDPYGNENKHNVSTQIDRQAHTLIGHINSDLPSSCKAPWIEKIIWLGNMPKSLLIDSVQPSHRLTSPLFPADFTWDEFLKKMARISKFKRALNHHHEEMVEELIKSVGQVVEFSDIDKRRFRKITSTNLDNDKALYLEKLGEQMLIFKGRGGTGKTARLIRLAHTIVKKQKGRVLFLTYNHSLRSEVQRVFNWLKLSNKIGDAGVYPDTVYSFMLAWFKAFEKHRILQHKTRRLKPSLEDIYEKWDKIEQSEREGDINFFDTFKPKQRLLIDAVKSGAIDDYLLGEVKNLVSKRLAWDFILVDEAQDWPEEERDFLFAFYGPKKIILADGEDQLVRSQVKTEWSLNGVAKQIVTLRKSLRLKSSLCDITNNVAKALNYNWSLEKDTEVHGGRVVIVYGDPLGESFYRRISSTIEQNNLSPIDVLSIVPPSMVLKRQNSEEPSLDEIDRDGVREGKYSLAAKLYEDYGELTWDATSDHVRKETPTRKSQFRCVTYESCRGLEGWIAVNYALDEFFDLKVSEFKSDKFQPGEMVFDEHQMAMEYATKWLMIPLTRAVDTLIIHIKNRESVLGQILEKMQKDNPSLITVEHI